MLEWYLTIIHPIHPSFAFERHPNWGVDTKVDTEMEFKIKDELFCQPLMCIIPFMEQVSWYVKSSLYHSKNWKLQC